MSIGRNFHMNIEVLTPLHIGSGREELLADYDFVTEKTIWVMDQQRMLEQVPEEVWSRHEVTARISQLLKPEQYPVCSRYRLNDPTRRGAVDKIVEHIKDARDQPYIPGSSLKGAMRTALAWALVKSGQVRVDQRDLRRDPRFADDAFMSRVFGHDPSHDLLRALHVVDTAGVPVNGGLSLAAAAVYSVGPTGRLEAKGAGYRFFVEVLPTGTVLHGSLRRDDYVLRDPAARELGFDRRRDALLGLIQHCNAFAQEVIAQERLFYRRHGLPRLAGFYSELVARAEALDSSCEFLMQMAWGTGWTSKTVGTALETALIRAAREQYSMGRAEHPIFPKSRRLVERGNLPEVPLGWVKVTLQPAS